MRARCYIAALVLAVAVVASHIIHPTADAEVAQFEDVPPALIELENVGTKTLKGVSEDGHGNGKVVVGEGPASGGVHGIIPEFANADEWHHADILQRNTFAAANEHYAKVNAKKYKAQGVERKKLNAAAQKALDALLNAKEAMQKKYAKDDPSDFGGSATDSSSDKADEKRYKKYPVKLGGSGSWGSSGSVDHSQKWYSDGVISTDGWLDKKGHYLLGAHRRRVGAGYGRRRAVIAANAPRPDGTDMAKIEKSHPALQEAFGPAADADEKKEKSLGKVPKVLSEAGVTGDVTAPKVDTAAVAQAKEEASLKARGLAEENPANLNDAQKKTLIATKAGDEPIMDTAGHFTDPVDDRIVGIKTADELDGKPDPYKCYEHGGNTMPMYTEAGCAEVGDDAKFAGVQGKYDNTYGECLKKQGGSYTWDKRSVCN